MAEETRLISSLTVLITELEQEAAAEVEAAGRRQAEKRLLGIRKAHGSLVSEYKEDKQRLNEAMAAVREAVARLNARGRQLEALGDEAAALADRFGLETPKLSSLREPDGDSEINLSLPRFWRIRAVSPATEKCEHNIRERRTFREIVGTEGYSIIEQAGLKPFRKLTQNERDVLEHQERKRQTVDPELEREAEIVRKFPPTVPYAYGVGGA